MQTGLRRRKAVEDPMTPHEAEVSYGSVTASFGPGRVQAVKRTCKLLFTVNITLL